MIYGWVIPYKPHMFVQLRMEAVEAAEIIKELKGLNTAACPKIVEVEKRLEELIQQANKLE